MHEYGVFAIAPELRNVVRDRSIQAEKTVFNKNHCEGGDDRFGERCDREYCVDLQRWGVSVWSELSVGFVEDDLASAGGEDY
jgi:hypothetical protein